MWIKVSDELLKNGDLVLCYNWTIKIARYYINTVPKGWFDSNNMELQAPPTHWMPLPPAPKD